MASPVVDIVLKAKDEASAAINALGKSIGGLNRAASALAPVAAGLGAIGAAAAVVGGAAFKMANDLSNTVERLDRLSETTGASIEQLQILEQTFKNAGLAPDTATLALVRLQKSIGDNDPLLKQLGITTRSTFDAMLQLSDIFERFGDNSTQGAIAAKLMGRGMADAAGTIRGLRGELDSTGDAMRKANAIIGGDGAATARKLDAALERLSITLAGLKNTIAAEVVPAVLALAAVIEDAMGRNDKAIVAFVAGAVANLGRFVILVEESFDKAALLGARFVKSWQNFGLLLKAAFSGAALPTMLPELQRAMAEYDALLDGFEQRTRERAERWKDIEFRLKFKAGEDSGEAFDPRTGAPVIGPATPKPAPPPGGVLDEGKESAREKRLRSIQNILLVSTADAGKYLAALEKIEALASEEKLKAEIRAAFVPSIAKDLQTQLDNLRLAARVSTAADDVQDVKPRIATAPAIPPLDSPISQEQIAEWDAQVRTVLDGTNALALAFESVGTAWLESVEEMTSAMGVIDAGMRVLFNGIEQGISTVFSRLTDQTQTFKSAMKTIFKAIADEALRELARIAAAGIFKFVVKLLLGIATGGASIATSVAGGVLDGGGGLYSAGQVRPEAESISRTVAPVGRVSADAFARSIVSAVRLIVDGGAAAGAAAGQVTNITNIQTYDARNTVLEMTSPGGALRRAGERVAVVGAY